MELQHRALWSALPGLPLVAAIVLWRAGHPFLGGTAVVVAIELAIAVLLVGWPATRRLTPALAPLFLSTVVGLYGTTDGGNLRGIAWGDPAFTDRAAALAGAGLVVAVLLAAGVDVARGIAWAVERIGHVLGVAAAGTIFVVLLVPAWAWSRIRRRDLLRGRRPASGGSTWSPHAGGPGRASSLGSQLGAHAGRRTLTGRLTWGLGCVVLLLGANYGAGWAWDRAVDSGAVPQAVAERASTDPARHDPRADLPAMAAYPWRERYFADIQHTQGGYWPFTEYRPSDFSSPYVNIKGWLRRSYRPKGDVSTMPKVWMFGGSTTWGEGQRDQHTIPSEVARLADRDGLPIVMDNYGERGWTHFQEMILYEQELGLHAAPAFSIFYDGANEITSQSLLNVAVPTHTLAYTYAEKLAGSTIATRFTQQPAAENPLGVLYHAYTQHSAVHKVAAWFRPAPAAAAEATPSQDGDPPGGEFTGGQKQDPGGSVMNYAFTPQDGTDAGKVYENGKQLTMALSKRYDVRSFLFWQPVGSNGKPQQNARAQLTAPTIDIADTLTYHPDVFIDGGHTNEVGARLVAEEIWKHVKPAVQKWYEEHR